MENRNTVIRASAGTGKTYRLSLEYIYFLLNNINFKNILVMTFTKKATFEIKERIFDFIEKIINKKEDYQIIIRNIEINFNYSFKENDIDKLKNIYSDMIINKSSIRIDTIDGFISKVFKKCISEPILNIYNHKVIEQDSELSFDIYSKIILELVKDKNFEYDLDGLDFDNIKSKLNTFFYNKEEIESIKLLKEEINLKDKIIEKARYIFFEMCIFSKELKKTEEIKKLILEIIDGSDKYKLLVKNLFEIREPKKIFGSNGKNLKNKEDILEICKEILNLLEMIYKEEYINETNELIKNAKVFYEKEFMVKKENSALEFNDITYLSLKNILDEKNLMVKNGRLTPMFFDLIDGNIDVLMVDEFQDTSIIQFKFIKLLMNEAKIVVCVGDEKQSIYEWRGGYKKLFEDLGNLLGNNTEIKTLDTCYRSEENIIKFVNDKFSKISSYKYDIVKSSKAERKSGYVKTIKIDKQEDAYLKIVELIKENNDFNETAILLRSNEELKKVSELLENEGIKYSLTSTSDLLEVDSVKITHKLVEYLATKNDLKKYEFLRESPLKYTLNDLKKIIDGNKIDDIFETFVNSYHNHNSISTKNYDFQDEYLKYFGYNIKNPSSTDIINLNEYFRIMKTFSSIEDFYKYITENKKVRKAVLEKDSVLLLTIHKSKGLEYKNVYTYVKSKKVLENSSIKYTNYDDEYNLLEFKMIKFKYLDYMNRICENENIGLSDVELSILKSHFKSLDSYKEYITISNQKESADLNVAYVSYTRAKDNCYIFYDKDDRLIDEEVEYGTRVINNDNKEEFEINIDDKYNKYFKRTNYEYILNEKYSIERIERQKIGSALHYFFEVYNGNKKVSLDRLNKKYANLFSNEILDLIYNLIDENLYKYRYIFENNLLKYNEFKIYDDFGNLYIIDLLVLDNQNKKAYIYDFKVGENVKNNPKYLIQIDNYKKILSKYLIDYEIFTELLPLEE